MKPSKFNKGFGVGEVYKEKDWKDLWVILIAVIPQKHGYHILKERNEGGSNGSWKEEGEEGEEGEAHIGVDNPCARQNIAIDVGHDKMPSDE